MKLTVSQKGNVCILYRELGNQTDDNQTCENEIELPSYVLGLYSNSVSEIMQLYLAKTQTNQQKIVKDTSSAATCQES